jgi:hypothetical protein
VFSFDPQLVIRRQANVVGKGPFDIPETCAVNVTAIVVIVPTCQKGDRAYPKPVAAHSFLFSPRLP